MPSVGILEECCLGFDLMQERNVSTWTALVCGAAEALSLLKMMQEAGVRPNEMMPVRVRG